MKLLVLLFAGVRSSFCITCRETSHYYLHEKSIHSLATTRLQHTYKLSFPLTRERTNVQDYFILSQVISVKRKVLGQQLLGCSVACFRIAPLGCYIRVLDYIAWIVMTQQCGLLQSHALTQFKKNKAEKGSATQLAYISVSVQTVQCAPTLSFHKTDFISVHNFSPVQQATCVCEHGLPVVGDLIT